MIWLEQNGEPFDAAIVDFPDPNSFSVGKLYTSRFYRLLRRRLSLTATVAVQSTSPLFARESFWCIVRTLEASGFVVRPYQIAVPSFGVWGFALASPRPFPIPSSADFTRAPPGLRCLNAQTMPALFEFSADTGPLNVEVNRLDNQSLVRYYESEWRKWE